MQIRVIVATCVISSLLAACSSEDSDVPVTNADTGSTSEIDTSSSGTDASTEEDTASADTSGPDRAELIQQYSNVCLQSCTQIAACDNTEYPLGPCEDACTETSGTLVSELPDSAEALGCVEAEITLEVCIGELTCDEVDQYFSESVDNYPCLAEETAATVACDGF